jgi:hypothetical protein
VYCTAKKGKQGEFRIYIDRTEGKNILIVIRMRPGKLKRELRSDKFQNLSLNDAINLRVLKVIPEELQL